MTIAEAAWSSFAGFLMLGAVTYAVLGTGTFLGAAPTAGAGGPVTFQ